MARSPTSSNAASLAPNSTLLLFLFLSLLSHTLAANSQPAPLPTLHKVVAPGVAAAPPPDRNHYNVANQPREQQPSGPYTPLVTPAPTAVSDEQALKNQGFRQETFYTCMTARSGREHCGWHTPVIKQPKQGSAAAAVTAPRRPTDTRIVVAVVVGLAGIFVVGMM